MSANPENQYAAWWLYTRTPEWRVPARDDEWFRDSVSELAGVINDPMDDVIVRGTYNSLGLSAGAEMIIWAHSVELAALQNLAMLIDRTAMGGLLQLRSCYIGIGGMSQYDPTHGPAFVKGQPAKRYLSVYPFTKTPDWYLIDYQERRRLMIEHGEMGREYPEILTNTVNSFGIQDQEFVVALEDDDPEQLIKMVQRLRSAEVRKWTAVDTPIYLGERKPAADVLTGLRGHMP